MTRMFWFGYSIWLGKQRTNWFEKEVVCLQGIRIIP